MAVHAGHADSIEQREKVEAASFPWRSVSRSESSRANFKTTRKLTFGPTIN